MNLKNIIMSLLLAGATLSQDGRIVGGFEVSPEFKYPWMVTIFRYGEYFCGGTLLSNNLVVTAAHCTGYGRAPLDTFEIQLHRHNLTRSLKEENGLAFKVNDVYVAKDYDPDTYYNDIAVFKFNNTKNTPRSNVQLDTIINHKDGFRVTALGWGATKVLGQSVPELREVWLPIYNKHCADIYKKELNYTIVSTQTCAGYMKGGKDTCQGDSGGPLFTYVNDKPLLVGVTSNGISCAKANTPAVYTRVARYNKWLTDILKGKIAPTPTPKD